ncbi:MAG: DUF2905 domain-containing protein [Bacteroidetes bacterium]|nr:DUF2905 domain-containing protein [Bacteroidota bacterium]
MQKLFIVSGVILVLIGIFWKVIIKFPFFRLPGDIIIENDNFKFYFPIVSMIIISVIISLIYWITKKF